MKFDRLKMCHECPFREASIRGWLGPYTIAEIEEIVHGEGSLVCHADVSKMIRRGLTTDEEFEREGQHCVGALRYASSVCKSYRDEEKADAQAALAVVPDQPLIAPMKFREHHSSGLLAEAENASTLESWRGKHSSGPVQRRKRK